MPYAFYIASELADVATLLATVPNNTSVYLYKDSNGIIKSSNVENFINSSQFGYAYNFINGDVVYTSTPITSNNNIPWLYPYTILTGNLWHNTLSFWLDAKEQRAISSSLQKWIAKVYSNNIEIPMIENTSNYAFTYDNNDTINLSGSANIESPNTITILPYFKIAMVLTIPQQNINNSVIFQHNNFILKISLQTAPDATSQYMISIFNNNTFLRGVSFKPADPTFKYYIYTDNNNVLKVSGNASVFTATGNYYQNVNQKVFMGQDNAGLNNSGVKLHEVLYYQSNSNNITPIDAEFYSYLSARWSLSTYTDTHNVYPITTSWANLANANDTFWSMTTYPADADTITYFMTNGTLSNSDRTFTLSGGGGYSDWFAFPLSCSNPIDISTAKAGLNKYYCEFVIGGGGAFTAILLGFCDITRSTFNAYTPTVGSSYHFGGRGGQNTYFYAENSSNASGGSSGFLSFFDGGRYSFELDYSSGTGYMNIKVNNSSLGPISHAILNFDSSKLVPMFATYNRSGFYIEYVIEASALYKPVGYTYIT